MKSILVQILLFSLACIVFVCGILICCKIRFSKRILPTSFENQVKSTSKVFPDIASCSGLQEYAENTKDEEEKFQELIDNSTMSILINSSSDDEDCNASVSSDDCLSTSSSISHQIM
jgi:hypothetical protein